jgi:hypothetical protein
MEILTYTKTDIERFKDHASSEICSWKRMIRQFSDLREKNEKELSALKRSPELNDKMLRKIEVLKALNRSLDDSIDECLDLILRNNKRIENFSMLNQPN